MNLCLGKTSRTCDFSKLRVTEPKKRRFHASTTGKVDRANLIEELAPPLRNDLVVVDQIASVLSSKENSRLAESPNEKTAFSFEKTVSNSARHAQR